MNAQKTPAASEPHQSPGERVYHFILGKISNRQWPVNSKILTENELCSTLGVSRIAVREAVERLVTLGLLVKKQGSGTYVAAPDADSCFNSLFPMILLDETNTLLLLEFRCQFEYGNIKLFMQHHRPEDIVALEENFAAMVAARPVNLELSGHLDFEFHQIIAMATRNPFVIRISNILTGILRTHQKLLHKLGDPDNPVEYHGDIIKYLKRGDGEMAALLMRKHIGISIESFQRNTQAQGWRTHGSLPDGGA